MKIWLGVFRSKEELKRKMTEYHQRKILLIGLWDIKGCYFIGGPKSLIYQLQKRTGWRLRGSKFHNLGNGLIYLEIETSIPDKDIVINRIQKIFSIPASQMVKEES